MKKPDPILFFDLPAEEQTAIIQHSANQLNLAPYIVEKDVWICWSLQQLFSIPKHHKMAFKGGTSLSKVFDLIYRFSEDVDITIDYKSFDNDFADQTIDTLSKTAIKNLSKCLKTQLQDYVLNVIRPYLQNACAKYGADVTVDDNGEKLWIKYHSVVQPHGYLKEGVLLEFGARNVTEPSEHQNIHSLIATVFKHDELILPEAHVDVLSPQRTFWEKVTLIHVECSKARATGEFKQNTERISRHWYDLYQLASSEHGKLALKNKALQHDVINHKAIFYNGKHYNYEACLAGQFLLIPDEAFLPLLEKDANLPT